MKRDNSQFLDRARNTEIFPRGAYYHSLKRYEAIEKNYLVMMLNFLIDNLLPIKLRHQIKRQIRRESNGCYR